MKKQITGLAYVVGDAIDTDQIIPAAHLVYSLTKPEERRLYGRYALSGLPDDQQGLPDGHQPFTPPEAYESPYTIVVAGSNFGCGSSREHAPFALHVAGCEAVLAESYARIFYRNTVDGGFLVPFETREPLRAHVRTGDRLTIDVPGGLVTNHRTGSEHLLHPLGEVAAILEAGNLFAYARKVGLIPSS
ncbi:MAG: 3-isopropylmalate dehydratase [Bacteroidota bacterium]